MLGLIFLNSRLRFPIIFFSTFVWIPFFRLTEAILGIASVLLSRASSPPELNGSGGGGGVSLLVRKYEELQRSDDRAAEEDQMCSICLTEFAREDSVCKLPDCSHVYHSNCIQKWLERNHFTCPLCRRIFNSNIENRHENKLRFVVPDNPYCLYYFLQ